MVSLRNGFGIWCVLPMPACATRYAGSPPISAPRKRTEPTVGFSAPAIRLKVVLLPEPFGPIRPRISPSATSKETFLTARKPSKLLVSPSTLSTYRVKRSELRIADFIDVHVLRPLTIQHAIALRLAA